MVSQRIELRLDEERRRKLARLVEEAGMPASEVLRRGIDALYEEWQTRRRQEALQRLLAIEIDDDVPDPAELSRQLAEAHDPGLP